MYRIRVEVGSALLFVLIASSLSFAQKGTMETGEVTSPALGGETKNFRVYLPPTYTTSEKEYPSFYVLHGANGHEGSLIGMRFTMDRMIRDGEVGEMIAVFVDGDQSWYSGEYEPYITDDLVYHIDAQYRTIPDRNSRGITGYSMGGFGSMHLAMKYPEVFAVFVSQAGRPDVNALDQYLSQPVRLNGIKTVYGRGDGSIGANRDFDQKLTEEGIDHEYVEHGGGHDFIHEESLGFLSDHLHPVREIARLREAVRATTTPGAIVVDEPMSLEVVVTLSVAPEAIETVQKIVLDLSPLGISSQVPLEDAGGGRYTFSRIVTSLRHGRHELPLMMETGFAWDIEGTRYALPPVELEVYLATDEHYVYQDAVEAGWEVKVFQAEVDLEASQVVHEGSYAQAVTMLKSGGNIRYIFDDPEGFSTFGYTGLSFWINPGTSSTETAMLGVRTPEGSRTIKLGEDLGITLTPEVWQRVSIPLAEFGLADTYLKEIRFQALTGTFYLDDQVFEAAAYRLSEAAAIPERVKPDGRMPALLAVQALPTLAEPDAPPTVTVDLSPIGGDQGARMLDDGTRGDGIAGDGIYTVEVMVSPETPKGIKDLVISSTDSRLRVVYAHIPLAVLPTEDMYVYWDEIAPGWKVSVRNVLSDPLATAFVYDGEYAQEISVQRSSNFVNYTWDDADGFDAFGYTDLVFQMLVTEPDQDPEVRLTPVTGDAVSFRLGDQLGEPGVWQEVWIPLGGLADAGFLLERFSFQRVDATLYIDDVRFVPEEVLEPSGPTAVEVAVESTVPSGYGLSQNHPNPFNPETTIRYELPTAGAVWLSLYNVSGQLIRTLVDGEHSAGAYSVTWDGRDDAGRDVASGVYVARMATTAFRGMRKLVLVR